LWIGHIHARPLGLLFQGLPPPSARFECVLKAWIRGSGGKEHQEANDANGAIASTDLGANVGNNRLGWLQSGRLPGAGGRVDLADVRYRGPCARTDLTDGARARLFEGVSRGASGMRIEWLRKSAAISAAQLFHRMCQDAQTPSAPHQHSHACPVRAPSVICPESPVADADGRPWTGNMVASRARGRSRQAAARRSGMVRRQHLSRSVYPRHRSGHNVVLNM